MLDLRHVQGGCAMSEPTMISFTPVPITGMIGCGIPVLPGTSDWDAPLEDRTELCAIDANWIVGAVPTCDLHVRLICEMVDIDWPGVVDEAGRDLDRANRPREDRQRHSQDAARSHLEHFTKDCE
jgi:hypothetical protein